MTRWRQRTNCTQSEVWFEDILAGTDFFEVIDAALLLTRLAGVHVRFKFNDVIMHVHHSISLDPTAYHAKYLIQS